MKGPFCISSHECGHLSLRRRLEVDAPFRAHLCGVVTAAPEEHGASSLGAGHLHLRVRAPAALVRPSQGQDPGGLVNVCGGGANE